MVAESSPRVDDGPAPGAAIVRHREESARRSFAKTVSWRIVGSLDTLLLSFVILSLLGPLLGMGEASHGQNARTAGAIAMTEIVTKIILYYIHERIWARSRWQVVTRSDGRRRPTATRSVVKTATWRMTASLDTTMLALIFTGNIGAALSIGVTEAFTKLWLYYVHERAWARVHWGTTA